MKKRMLTSIFSCLMALSLAACNSNTPNDTEYSDTSANDAGNISVSEDTNSKFISLDIAESGYTMIEGGFLYCSVKVHNPNTDLAILYPTIRITARDASGALLGTQDQTLSTIYPQQDFWYSGQLLQVDEAPSSVDSLSCSLMTIISFPPLRWNNLHLLLYQLQAQLCTANAWLEKS